MTASPDVDDDFRAATRGLELAPVRWGRVRFQARMGWLMIGLLTVALAVVISAVAILSKHAIDPTYTPGLPGIGTGTTLEPQVERPDLPRPATTRLRSPR
jgi:hypothetical protein